MRAKRWRKKLVCPYCEIKHFRRRGQSKNYYSDKDACRECEDEEESYARLCREEYYSNCCSSTF